ncbi:Cell wall assembly regulator [Microbotryomycetes sp. JL201]|nr:Cell wall assembly regulator [Microbotryomycetes sp. JL201]
MFARLFGGAAAAVARPRASSVNGQPNTTADEHEYTDVALGAGQPSPTAYDAPASARPSFSQAPTSRGSFLGAEPTTTAAGGNSASFVSQAYPPLPAFSHPSSTNGYPPLKSTFARLRHVLHEQSPALLDSLSEPLAPTDPALASLLHAISPYYLPSAVLESYQIHDGQDAFASSAASPSSGLVWGLWWLSLDQVEQEWQFWRRFEQSGGMYGLADKFSTTTTAVKTRTRAHPYVNADEDGTKNNIASHQASTSATTLVDGAGNNDDGGARAPGQSSFPPGWVRAKYSHPGWLPLLTDRCGNYIGVDLDPPPPSSSHSRTSSTSSTTSAKDGSIRSRSYGQPGQVIAFGREIDQKVVLFPGDGAGGWGRFLAAFVDDIERGEFAELVEAQTSRARQSRVNGWARDDVESGRHAGSDEDDTSSPGSDEWGLGDGVGERSYFDTDRYGAEGDDRAGTEKQTWKLRSEYKKWLREDGSGGVIGVIAERSRRKWKSLGVGSRQPSGTTIPIVPPQRQQPSARPPLSVVVPEDKPDEMGPESAVTIKGGPAPEGDLQDTGSTYQPNVVLSPPTPGAAASTVDPFSAASHRRTTSAESKKSAESPTLSASRRDSLHPQDSSRNHRERQQQPIRRKRPPPPPPAAISVPTVGDLDYGGPVSNSAQRAAGRLSHEGSVSPARSSFASLRSTSSHENSNALPLSRHDSVESTRVVSSLARGNTGSTTALVDGHDNGQTSALPSPQDEKAKLEIVIDRSVAAS